MQGYLLPTFHKSYWMGLAVSPGARWPKFAWLDRSPAVYNGNYQHWGMLNMSAEAGVDSGDVAGEGLAKGSVLEPNNLVPPEQCAVSNLTATYDRAGGWADARCDLQFVFICKLQGAPTKMHWHGSYHGTCLELTKPLQPLPHAVADQTVAVGSYTSSTNSTFTFWPAPMPALSAEATCNSKVRRRMDA